MIRGSRSKEYLVFLGLYLYALAPSIIAASSTAYFWSWDYWTHLGWVLQFNATGRLPPHGPRGWGIFNLPRGWPNKRAQTAKSVYGLEGSTDYRQTYEAASSRIGPPGTTRTGRASS